MLGGVGSSCLTVTLAKVLESLILENAKVSASLELLVNGSYEDVPLGKFTVDDIDKGTSSNNTVKLTCYDNMILLEQAYFSDLTYPTDINNVAQEICTKAGVELASTLPNIQVNKIEGYTYREAVGFIASFLGGFARFNRDGKLEITSYTESGISLDKNDYTSSFKTNATTFAIGKLSCQVNDNTILSAGSYGNEIQFKNPIMTQDQLNSIYNALKSLNYMPYSADWRGNPALQSGDKITITDTKGNTFNTLVMDNKFTYKGGLSGHIEAVGKTETGQNFSSSGNVSNTVDRLVTEQANIKVLLADKATIEQLNVTNENVQNLIADNAKINNLVATKANITDLNVTNESVKNLQVDKANITDLQASNARINTLEASTANINHILAGNITAENIAAGTIAAGSSIIANGAIGSAQISDLDVSKLNAGTLDTTKITIAGANSRLLIKGNRLQVFATKADNSLYERVSLGDVNGDGSVYGFRVRGADGTTVLLDETGVKREGITDGSINNAKIGSDANISGTKLDINSVVTAINGGTTSIQGSKVLLNGQGLDVQFSNITTTVNQKANTTDVTNAINAIQVGGTNLILNSDFSLSTGNVFVSAQTITIVSDDTYGYCLKVVTTSGGGTNTGSYLQSSVLTTGNRYSYSAYIKADATTSVYMGYQGSGTSLCKLFNVTTNWQRIKIENELDTNNNRSLRFYSSDGVTFYITRIKFEQGTKATDWSPAPEDTQSQIDTANSNITSIQTTVSSHTSSITQLQNSITLKVDTQTFTNYQSTVNGQISSINNTLSSQSSSISVLQNQITSKVTQTDINTSINNLNIGGTNLAVGYGVYTSSAPFILSGTAKDLYYYFSSPSNRFYLKAGSYYFHVESDGTWTITHDTSGGTASSPNVVLWLAEYANSTTTTISSAIILTNGAKHTITTSGYYSFRVNCYSDGTATVTHNFWNFQIESGDKLTNWSPAPQDFQNQIDTTNSNLNTANSNITTLTTRISTAESSITQLQNSITLKVSTSDFTSYQNTVSNNFSTTNSNVTTAQNTANTAVTNASTAQTAANSAQTTANAKKRVFTSQPAPPYDVGDLWSQGTSGDMMVCKTGRASGSYTATDWAKGVKYTDDTTANAVQSNLNTTNSNLSSLTSRVSTAESKITSDAIVNTVRTSTAYISDLGQKITSAQATTIAQTSSNIKIGFNGISNKVVIDTTGITINNGGFTIKNQSNATVLSEDANGNLTMAGTLKTLQDDGTDAITMSDTNIFFHDWGSGAGNNIGKIYSSHDTTSPYAAGYSIGVNRNYKFGLTYQNLETDSSGNTYTPLLVLNNGSNNGGIGRIDMWNAYLWNSTLEWRFKSTATIVANSSININHNLNKMPMITAVGTVGNIVLTFSYVDANTIRIYNYNNGGSGGNTWTGDIYFGKGN
ncbi:hypothetical protein AGR56_17965 [Clostridium sp. DMHC 10]|uniref:beta strand repeat-containing protein n=1 Tax=Clostridium sp. DMHC 10 TaxID=747377 RepID=UPI00069D8723|nr:hypothetical protein [Clostridium sp. DMHC 10]KOF55718.1 hypothetical protein AGR56_17965 [Clostridium sp. DMHC 10]